MMGVAKSAGCGFRFVVWAVVIVSITMIIAGSVDVIFQLRWGFTPKDVIMAVVVLLITLLVKIVGSKIIAMFAGG